MPRQRLAASLANIHAELQKHPALSADDRALLQTALADIQAALDQGKPHAPNDVAQRLESAALSFENKHPTLTTLVTELVDAIRGAGV